jgi:hypothetical protein
MGKVGFIPGNESEPILQSNRRDQRINGRHRLATLLKVGYKRAPGEHDLCINRQNPALESHQQVPFQPLDQGLLAPRRGKFLDSFKDFSNRDHAEIEPCFIDAIDPLEQAGIGLRSNQV